MVASVSDAEIENARFAKTVFAAFCTSRCSAIVAVGGGVKIQPFERWCPRHWLRMLACAASRQFREGQAAGVMADSRASKPEAQGVRRLTDGEMLGLQSMRLALNHMLCLGVRSQICVAQERRAQVDAMQF